MAGLYQNIAGATLPYVPFLLLYYVFLKFLFSWRTFCYSLSLFSHALRWVPKLWFRLPADSRLQFQRSNQRIRGIETEVGWQVLQPAN